MIDEGEKRGTQPVSGKAARDIRKKEEARSQVAERRVVKEPVRKRREEREPVGEAGPAASARRLLNEAERRTSRALTAMKRGRE